MSAASPPVPPGTVVPDPSPPPAAAVRGVAAELRLVAAEVRGVAAQVYGAAAEVHGAAAEARSAAAEARSAVLPGPVSEPAARMLAVLGLAAIAIIHILDSVGAFSGAKYIFWLYIAIVVGVIPVSLALLHWSSPLAWAGVAAVAAGPLLGYLLTRSVGLPGDSADIGDWLDTLGLSSMFVETGVLSLALVRLGLGFGFGPGRRPPASATA